MTGQEWTMIGLGILGMVLCLVIWRMEIQEEREEIRRRQEWLNQYFNQ
jgi:mannose/fructose/N-acetylgalactosamine-specific phosphotransferase system component IIC